MKQFALITGASSGIGEQICHSLAKRGFNVILTSRTESKLKTISEKINNKNCLNNAHIHMYILNPMRK